MNNEQEQDTTQSKTVQDIINLTREGLFYHIKLQYIAHILLSIIGFMIGSGGVITYFMSYYMETISRSDGYICLLLGLLLGTFMVMVSSVHSEKDKIFTLRNCYIKTRSYTC